MSDGTQPPECLYSTGTQSHPADPPVRVATVHTADGTPSPRYACPEHTPAETLARGGEPQ